MGRRTVYWLATIGMFATMGLGAWELYQQPEDCPAEPIVSGGVVCVCLETVSPPMWECFPGPEQYDVNVELPAEFPISLEE